MGDREVDPRGDVVAGEWTASWQHLLLDVMSVPVTPDGPTSRRAVAERLLSRGVRPSLMAVIAPGWWPAER